jgi:hypothetical protein
MSCDLFGIFFGKYRNRTKNTEIEFPRYRFLEGIDQYLFPEEPNFSGNQSTEPIGSRAKKNVNAVEADKKAMSE